MERRLRWTMALLTFWVGKFFVTVDLLCVCRRMFSWLPPDGCQLLPLTPVVTTTNVSRCCHMSLGGKKKMTSGWELLGYLQQEKGKTYKIGKGFRFYGNQKSIYSFSRLTWFLCLYKSIPNVLVEYAWDGCFSLLIREMDRMKIRTLVTCYLTP